MLHRALQIACLGMSMNCVTKRFDQLHKFRCQKVDVEETLKNPQLTSSELCRDLFMSLKKSTSTKQPFFRSKEECYHFYFSINS